MRGKKFIIHVGEQYGRWTVLEVDVYNPDSKAKTKIKQCLCECSCDKHTHRYIPGSKLVNGETLSCGCLRNEQLAKRNAESSSVKVGNRYGKLVVIQDLGMRKQASRNKNERWSLCQCDCGSEPIEAKNNLLQNGWKKSCGCLQSQGEFVIEKILKDNNIQYIKEYSFEDLKGKKNKLRFDFAIFENTELKCLIEFDGRQHFTGPEASWKNARTLEEIQEYDELKNKYCQEHNIILKRVPYYDIKEVTYEKLFIKDEYDIK